MLAPSEYSKPTMEKNSNNRSVDIDLKRVQVLKNTIIIGWNIGSLNLYDKIKENPALGYRVKGFITLQSKRNDEHYQDVPLLGDLSTLHSWVRLLKIEHILIAINPNEQSRLTDIIEICVKTSTQYTIVSDVYDTIYGNVIHDVYTDLFAREEFGVRRLVDFFGAVALLLILFPFFLIVALAIKLESRGSIFYSQIRVGKKGKEFRIFKFRSMIQDAEKSSGPIWAQKGDPRVTKVGRFMRVTRIDELPQLLNILKGDMSFIGPRPERPFFVDSFKQQIPLYETRLKIKPGVTGWAQVKWRYDESLEDVKQKLSYDLFYINNHTFWMDLRIFLLTFSTVMLQKGQ